MQKPWPQMSEADQRTWINRIEERAHQLVDEVVEHVNHGDFPVINAMIESFTVKKGEVKVITKGFADNDMLAVLNDAGEKRVQITVMRNDQFNQQIDPLHPDPDQPGLPGVKMGEPGFEDDDEDEGAEADEMYEKAVELIRKETKASASFLQRQLSIGYNRASSYIERMEADGIVSAPNEKGGRTVLVNANPPGEAEAGEAILTPKSDQWRGGFNSRMGAHPRADNPFNPGAPGHADWFLGWDAADFDATAPALNAHPAGPVSDGSEVDPNDATAPEPVADPKPKAKRTPKPKAGPVVEPDIEPEAEAPAAAQEPAPEDNADGAITDEEGIVIESIEHAAMYGAWCRSDGKGTGSNPFPSGSEFFKAWLRGYSEQRRKEQENPAPADEF